MNALIVIQILIENYMIINVNVNTGFGMMENISVKIVTLLAKHVREVYIYIYMVLNL